MLLVIDLPVELGSVDLLEALARDQAEVVVQRIDTVVVEGQRLGVGYGSAVVVRAAGVWPET